MNPDSFKEAWRAQTSQTRLTIDADLLLKEVRRNQSAFTAIIFWRDVREVGVSLLMVPIWLYLGAKHTLPWTWYLGVPALLWIAGFMLVDRMRHKQHSSESGASLRRSVESSLGEVEHQIWLLRNVLWWYLLPPGLAVLAFFGQCAWTAPSGVWWIPLFITGAVALEALVVGGTYWLNQKAVSSELEPRRQELQGLLASLTDATEAGQPAVGPDGGAAKPRNVDWMNNQAGKAP
jgi:hypothetical protein